MSEQITVYHPTIEGVTNDVPKGDAEKWLKQGWLKSDPASRQTAASTAKTAAAPRKRTAKKAAPPPATPAE